MAIKIPSGFNITVKEPVDSRLVLTKAQMRDMIAAKMPDNYICICSDDSKLYIYNSKNTPSATTGYFTEYSELVDLPKAIAKGMSSAAGKAALEEAVGGTLPGALEKAMTDSTQAEKIADAMFNSEHFEVGLDRKIDIAISMIEAIDGMAE